MDISGINDLFGKEEITCSPLAQGVVTRKRDGGMCKAYSFRGACNAYDTLLWSSKRITNVRSLAKTFKTRARLKTMDLEEHLIQDIGMLVELQQPKDRMTALAHKG